MAGIIGADRAPIGESEPVDFGAPPHRAKGRRAHSTAASIRRALYFRAVARMLRTAGPPAYAIGTVAMFWTLQRAGSLG